MDSGTVVCRLSVACQGKESVDQTVICHLDFQKAA